MWHVLFLLLLAADTGPADRLFREGKFAEAVTAYGRLVNADPSAADAMAGLGRSLLELHRTADAIQYLERAVRLKPDLVEARLALARAFVESGNLAPVMSLVEPVYERQPADPQTLHLMIEGFYGGGYYQRALQLIGELRKMPPRRSAYPATLRGVAGQGGARRRSGGCLQGADGRRRPRRSIPT